MTSPTSSNPLLPSFVAVWIEMFLHALCGTENKNPSKKKVGNPTKLEIEDEKTKEFLCFLCPEPLLWPIHVNRRIVGDGFVTFRRYQFVIAYAMATWKFENCRFHNRCRWFYRCISSFICFISQILLPCFSFFTTS